MDVGTLHNFINRLDSEGIVLPTPGHIYVDTDSWVVMTNTGQGRNTMHNSKNVFYVFPAGSKEVSSIHLVLSYESTGNRRGFRIDTSIPSDIDSVVSLLRTNLRITRPIPPTATGATSGNVLVNNLGTWVLPTTLTQDSISPVVYQSCTHDYVNIGFTSLKLACKKCGCDKPEEK